MGWTFRRSAWIIRRFSISICRSDQSFRRLLFHPSFCSSFRRFDFLSVVLTGLSVAFFSIRRSARAFRRFAFPIRRSDQSFRRLLFHPSFCSRFRRSDRTFHRSTRLLATINPIQIKKGMHIICAFLPLC
ncbi:hypothetical protein [Lysinibacillus xylanilyticus]|uniref:hypothetical protein n=1 Tax=Lysinibacillus xylanilyticus TaxID=582475 RepID=UPI003D97CB1A